MPRKQYTAHRYGYEPMNSSFAQSIIDRTTKESPEDGIAVDIGWSSRISEEELNEEMNVYVNSFGRVDAVEGESFFLVVTET